MAIFMWKRKWPELAWNSQYFAECLIRRAHPADLRRAAGVLEEGSTLARSLGLRPLAARIEALRRSSRMGDAAQSASPFLSAQESRVLRLVARGFTNCEIGERLFISEHTAAKHAQNIVEKTGMSNRAEASAFAATHGMLDQ